MVKRADMVIAIAITGIGAVFLMVVISVVFAFPTMWAWNILMPHIIQAPANWPRTCIGDKSCDSRPVAIQEMTRRTTPPRAGNEPPPRRQSARTGRAQRAKSYSTANKTRDPLYLL